MKLLIEQRLEHGGPIGLDWIWRGTARRSHLSHIIMA
jgi:hypothetical protein